MENGKLRAQRLRFERPPILAPPRALPRQMGGPSGRSSVDVFTEKMVGQGEEFVVYKLTSGFWCVFQAPKGPSAMAAYATTILPRSKLGLGFEFSVGSWYISVGDSLKGSCRGLWLHRREWTIRSLLPAQFLTQGPQKWDGTGNGFLSRLGPVGLAGHQTAFGRNGDHL